MRKWIAAGAQIAAWAVLVIFVMVWFAYYFGG